MMNRHGTRNSRSPSLAVRSRHKKALFMPLSRTAADELVLPVRIAFERIRRGAGDRAAAVCMAEILLLTGFLTEGGFGLLDSSFLDETEKQLLSVLTRDSGGETHFAVELVEALGDVVNEYDRLMRETRLQAIVEANESFAKLRPST